jgi:hypothetical protein
MVVHRSDVNCPPICMTNRESSREQADVSAEQPAPRQDAWLPAANEHPGRSGHSGGPSPQGSRRAFRLIALRS